MTRHEPGASHPERIGETVTRYPSDVVTAKGRLYVSCLCRRRLYLYGWGAAHVGICAFSMPCEKCGRRIVMEQRDEEV